MYIFPSSFWQFKFITYTSCSFIISITVIYFPQIMKTLVILIPNQTIEIKLNNSPLYPEIGICMQYILWVYLCL